MKCFHLYVSSISYDCLHVNSKWSSLRMLCDCGHFDRNEIWFQVIKYHVDNTRNEITRKNTSAHVFISLKQKWLDFIEWAVFVGPPPKQNFILFLPQWKVMETELFLWWVKTSFKVDFISSCKSTLKLNQLYFCASDKLVIVRQSRAIWQIFSSFLVFSCYFAKNENTRKIISHIAKF